MKEGGEKHTRGKFFFFFGAHGHYFFGNGKSNKEEEIQIKKPQ